MEIPEPPVLKEPDRQHGERKEETVDEQAEAVEPVKLGLFLVDAKLRREEILFGHGVRDGGGHDGVVSLRVELEIQRSPDNHTMLNHTTLLFATNLFRMECNKICSDNHPETPDNCTILY